MLPRPGAQPVLPWGSAPGRSRTKTLGRREPTDVKRSWKQEATSRRFDPSRVTPDPALPCLSHGSHIPGEGGWRRAPPVCPPRGGGVLLPEQTIPIRGFGWFYQEAEQTRLLKAWGRDSSARSEPSLGTAARFPARGGPGLPASVCEGTRLQTGRTHWDLGSSEAGVAAIQGRTYCAYSFLELLVRRALL